MFRNLFKPDSALMIVMSNITDCIFLSLFWMLCCFPVVTVGAAFAALYDASFRSMRQGEKNSWKRFLHVLRTNWKIGIVPGFVVVLVLMIVGLGLIQFWNGAAAGQVSMLLFAAVAFLAVLVLGIVSLVFPILSRFENGALSVLRNAFLLGLVNLPRTLALGILNAVTIFFCARYIIPLFFLPSLACLLGRWLIEPMFKPFMEENEAAE